jgi:hypothetical protein
VAIHFTPTGNVFFRTTIGAKNSDYVSSVALANLLLQFNHRHWALKVTGINMIGRGLV